MMMNEPDDDEAAERRNAELEFVAAAYTPVEAWTETGVGGTSVCSVHRRLLLPSMLTADDDAASIVILVLNMPRDYPTHSPLEIVATVKDCSNSSMKSVWNALPHLIDACREKAARVIGEEAVLTVLSRADEWIQEEWPKYGMSSTQEESAVEIHQKNNNTAPLQQQVLGRRLIYSHHLISKAKRADIQDLCSHYNLTGYMKVGWPGIILIEGMEENCNQFYDEIRRWAWKYLVVRGEQHEENGIRKFASFIETEDMSIVAQHCRQVGLEALFKTSMKVYDNQDEDDKDEEQESLCGTLVLVDHMNDGKQYRKWLRKTSRQLDCLLFMQQCYLDYTKKPLIFVGVVGARVSEFMKRWRTSRVDVDSKGRPCLERQMTVLIDGPMDCTRVETLDWDKLQAEDRINVSLEQLKVLIDSVGGAAWSSAFEDHLKS